jgi:hypothetical protein
MVRLVTLIDDVGPTTFTRSVLVFRAPDWESARMRAIELGRAAEDSYVNADEQRVTRRLISVETLDLLGDDITDGREVYSEPIPVGAELVPAVFDPEDSPPTQSGV